jgi:cyclase
MSRIRLIPVLLLKDGGLVKTVGFKNPVYVGDPINAVRIFNEKEVDELVIVDIEASFLGVGPNFELLAEIAGEAFMPLCYGGGIQTIDQIKKLYKLGVEKVIINTGAFECSGLVREASSLTGRSGIVVAIDVRRNWRGQYSVYIKSGNHDIKLDPVEYAIEMVSQGAGEIIINSINQDGTMSGYDLEIIGRVAKSVQVPVVALGGAGKLIHFREAIEAGASAVAGGSIFVFHGRHRAVLITYPEHQEIRSLFP